MKSRVHILVPRFFPSLQKLTGNRFEWSEDKYSDDVQALYNFVAPEQDRETPEDQQKLFLKFPTEYRLFTCRDNAEQKKLVGMMIFSPLPKTLSIYIEIIAVHPDYRNLKISAELYQLFLNKLESEGVRFTSVSIEAYLHNVDYFINNLGMSDPGITYSVERCVSPVKFLSTEKNPNKALEIINEWNEFTKRWPEITSKNEFIVRPSYMAKL